MNKNKRTPFQNALLNSVVKDYEELLQHEPAFVPSDHFEQWAQNMMRKKTHKTAGRFAKAVLIAVLITALLAVSALAIPAIREAIINFFLIEYDDHYSITFDPEQAVFAPSEIETAYSVDFVPDEYFLISEDYASSGVSLLWINQEDDYINFTQWIIPENVTADSWLGLHNEEERLSIIMGNYQVEVVENQDNRKLIWTNNSYIFVLEFSADLTQEEIEKMFFSWKPVE